MAITNARPLKAYVRFDGTGRIVPSSLILRRKMPKVGKWVEIPAYECCNYVPTSTTTTSSTTSSTSSTTTSTSTSTTTSTTTTAVPAIEYRLSIFSYDTSGESCSSGAGSPNSAGYSAESNPLLITTFYSDPSLTGPVSGVNKFVAYAKASDPGVVYTARIDESGVVTENTAC